MLLTIFVSIFDALSSDGALSFIYKSMLHAVSKL